MSKTNRAKVKPAKLNKEQIQCVAKYIEAGTLDPDTGCLEGAPHHARGADGKKAAMISTSVMQRLNLPSPKLPRLVLIATDYQGWSEDKCLALHSCDNPSCFNPEHLRWGSYSDNRIDAIVRHRCPEKRERMTDFEKELILSLTSKGVGYYTIADELRIPRGTVGMFLGRVKAKANNPKEKNNNRVKGKGVQQ